MGYKILLLPKAIMTVSTPDQGYGKINGTTKKIGAKLGNVPVCVFKRSNRQLLWETKSKADGTYTFKNIAKGLECFIVTFDPSEEYNAVISDKVIAE